MEFETVERCGRIHVVKNSVESAGFIKHDHGGGWGHWGFFLVAVGLADEGLAAIAERMDDWYTASEAAERLAEMDVFDKPPTAKKVCGWARDGLLPGAMKITGKGGAGQSGSWRISESALEALAERSKRKCG